ncbi:MAG TPA: hypothetical protein VIV11_26405 [Kofleriaceae bacterium]
MRRALLFATLAVGCGRSEGVPDEKLGGLVIAPKTKAEAIDVARAAKDPKELSRALMLPYRDVVTALGPHTFSLSTTTTVEEGGKKVSEITDQTKIELGDNAKFSAVYTNSSDYGREVIHADGKLFLRPRYQRWHGRAPEHPDEPNQIRDSFFVPIAATWDLLAPAAELSDLGTAQVAGRSGKKIAVKLSPDPGKPPEEALTQRKWREKRSIEAISGEVVLDADKGVPLSVKLAGTISFSRDGRRFTMKVSVEASAAAIGPVAVAAPAPEQVVSTPERLREVDDRDFLLQGIAPPLRRNPDGTPVTPQPKAAGSASVTPQPKEAGSNSQKK